MDSSASARRFRTEIRFGLALAVATASAGLWWPSLGRWLGDEAGPVEQLAAALWLVCGLHILWMQRPSRVAAWALAVLCIGLAVREHGLPPEWIPSGKALTRWSHYTDPSLPLAQRWIEGLLVLGFVLAAVLSAWQSLLFVVRYRGWGLAGGRVLIAAVVALGVAQGLENRLGESGVLLEEILECLGAGWLWLSVRMTWPLWSSAAPERLAPEASRGWSG